MEVVQGRSLPYVAVSTQYRIPRVFGSMYNTGNVKSLGTYLYTDKVTGQNVLVKPDYNKIIYTQNCKSINIIFMFLLAIFMFY